MDNFSTQTGVGCPRLANARIFFIYGIGEKLIYGETLKYFYKKFPSYHPHIT